VQRWHNWSPAASFANCVTTLYLLKVHLQTFLCIPLTQKCQISSCDIILLGVWYVALQKWCIILCVHSMIVWNGIKHSNTLDTVHQISEQCNQEISVCFDFFTVQCIYPCCVQLWPLTGLRERTWNVHCTYFNSLHSAPTLQLFGSVLRAHPTLHVTTWHFYAFLPWQSAVLLYECGSILWSPTWYFHMMCMHSCTYTPIWSSSSRRWTS